MIQAPFASIVYQDRDVSVPTFRDDVTWTAGQHTFQFGGSFKPIRQNTTLTNDFDFPTVGLGGGLTALSSTFRPAGIRSDTTTAANWDAAYALALGHIGALSTRYLFDTGGAAQPRRHPRPPGPLARLGAAVIMLNRGFRIR